jgi:epoxide hydrolase-like predicted phosphatase
MQNKGGLWMEIRAVIFDFGGVMATFFRPELFQTLEAELGLQAESLSEILWRSPEWRLAEVGAIDEQEYWQRIAPRLGFHGQAERTQVCIRDLQRALFGEVEVDPKMVDLVRGLRGRYRTGLLSNTSASQPQRLVQRYNLEGLFDVVVLSAAVGLAKPDPAIYRLALQRLGAAPEATVFVDDYEPNVAAAAEQGIQGVRFTGYEALVSALEGLGVDLL